MQYKEKPNGVTRMSIEFLAKSLLKTEGKVNVIEGRIDDSGDMWVVFLTDRDSIMVNGFSWGYGGEGPRGLYDAAQKLGFTQLTREVIASIPMNKRWQMRLNPLVYDELSITLK